MKKLLLISAFALFFFSCKKGSDSGSSNEIIIDPPKPPAITVNFLNNRVGADSILSVKFAIKNATVGASFTYSISGELKDNSGQNTSGMGVITSNNTTINTVVSQYIDGKLTLNVVIADKTYIATIEKEQYKIRHWTDYFGVNNDLKGNYTVENDIVFPDKSRMDRLREYMIGDFAGTFDGKGYKISNISLQTLPTIYPNLLYLVGFFRYLKKSAVVKNVNLQYAKEGILQNLDVSSIGAFVARSEGTIMKCSVSCDITYMGTSSFGMAGFCGVGFPGSMIIASSYQGDIKTNKISVVGFVHFGNIIGCYAKGSIQTNGGFVCSAFTGYKSESDNIVSCFSLMNVLLGSGTTYSFFIPRDENKMEFGNIFNCHTITEGSKNHSQVFSHINYIELMNSIGDGVIDEKYYPAGFVGPVGGKFFKRSNDASNPLILWWQ